MQRRHPTSATPTAPQLQQLLTLTPTPKGTHFSVGERVKGRLELPEAALKKEQEFHLTYYQAIQRSTEIHRIPLAFIAPSCPPLWLTSQTLR